ncbi:hypothetical protein ADUPG1_005923 [Aduncisulcus paluster]|uniref:Uncharacterized protein n=1 Tax=Aduncisulcus paluster TaxID=2918883 RepID=A0ABQ5KG51_9EUKA|nr:hypothetical protein ADUPG1_005923 [Aduncisulcus paluster]
MRTILSSLFDNIVSLKAVSLGSDQPRGGIQRKHDPDSNHRFCRRSILFACVSTGKEANVYHSTDGKHKPLSADVEAIKISKNKENIASFSSSSSKAPIDSSTVSEYAVKVYKTSIMQFS